ncbi:hypothetical protein LshimejAT787_1200160 [Lyophyllum shimeji]|uniref:Uncharacterized protein n=1 Tax=Lyophyllum shimeji TaxID=47721 RepID=A0A9P3URT7_LYOSH|nr:hypothetical protein LshimejAT787_1200160 [Lyophyllum shimeji]
MGFTSFRMGHVHKPNHLPKHTRRAVTPNPSCATGGFYKAPANGAKIDSLKPLDIEWDSTCLDTAKVDIHLLEPGFNGDTTEMAVWPNVNFADGKHSVTIKPKWWNATSSVNLELTIVPAGTVPGSTTLPAGPIFAATYTPPADGSIPPTADTSKPDNPNQANSDVMSGAGTNKSLSGGRTAAAVLLPLLIVGLAIFLYLRYQRRKSAQKSRRFSEAIDKRMSTISTDWKSMSAAGAQAAIRNSIAVSRESSAFAFGAIRPLSTVGGGEMAGVGVGAQGQQMTQVRTGTGVGLRNPGAAAAIAAERASRVSRVSFADTLGRPSGESRRTRAFHDAYVPPLPTAPRTNAMSTASVYPDSELERDGAREKEKGSPTLSPRQATGPLTLTPEDIRARIQGRVVANEARREQEAEYDEVMPALSMMRTGLEPSTPTATSFPMSMSMPVPMPAPAPATATEEYLSTPLPAPPAPTHPSPISPPSAAHSFTGATYAPTLPSPISTGTASTFSPSAYAYNPAFPQPPPTPVSPQHTGGTATNAMSPDEMLRAYAERKAASGSPAPPSAFSHSNPASPRVKGRKLSLRASFGIKGLKGQGPERTQSPALDKAAISYPMPAAPKSPAGAAGMAGVGARGMAGVGAGMAGVGAAAGAQYAIGEDEDEEGPGAGEVDYESAYVV